MTTIFTRPNERPTEYSTLVSVDPSVTPAPHRHFLVHKPYGYLSQFISHASGETKKKKLGELHNFPAGTMAVGRLDENSEGLLLLTTDGKVSERIRGNGTEKEYYAQLDGQVSDEALAHLQAGVEIGLPEGKFITSPCKAFRLDPAPDFAPRSRKIRDDRHGPTSWLSITLTEGKFRQIRKMTAAVGFPTLRLVRVRVGQFKLGNMASGAVVEVAELEC